MDDTYQAYVNRVARLTLLDTYKSQVEHIQESPKFRPEPDGGRSPVAFPGYTVITPPSGEESENAAFYASLDECQEALQVGLETGAFVPVPKESFHFTLADLIWDSAYLDAIKNPEFEGQLRSRIGECFADCKSTLIGDFPIRWMVLGLMVRTRALGVCLAPKDESSYKQIWELRRSIYQNSDLMALGIEQQYHFTAHITLGYFGDLGSGLDRDRFSTLLSQLNDRWLDAPQEIWIHRAELRKFDDMTRYYRESDWPSLEFIGG
ncbi:DUF1868 domain-containing protein [Oscillatoriales cyanobacterium USR001]|nr:DUF1868 domain-containing protein [Oscillatoriales cyanobacterium USR001]